MKVIGMGRIISVITIGFLVLGGVPAMSNGAEINSADFQLSQKETPLKNIRPKTFVAKDIKDMRGYFNQQLVYKFRTGNKMTEVTLNKPVATVIQTLVKGELERNGHKCIVDSQEAKPDFVIAGSVLRFDINEPRERELTALVSLKLTILNAANRKGAYSNKYDGAYSFSIAADKDRTAQEKHLLNQAILDMLGKITSDPKLLEFLSNQP